ncbi:MAG TPA: tRNA pseudouridine(38-40) synthase TruA [Gemmatimonadaceae bacterium]|jgi:tRNA pseudouridine38-40 synthase|nr:tRNA pseudouridine(38-40) synthase TruA [Gemmatimonadaceae bacterium]
MTVRCVQLVLHYDGTKFAGWQRQPDQRTIQGELERVLTSLCDQPIAALGAGRTDAGVHARGQAVGVRVPVKWTASALRRSLNALLPPDLWVAASHEMREDFHARYSALSRGYSYFVGTDDEAHSPFRRRTEWPVSRNLDRAALVSAAATIEGEHSFRGFAVRGTAPEDDNHRCQVLRASWRERPGDAGLQFEIEANRFLHHMVRFLVGTMVAIATRERDPGDVARLLEAESNDEVSPPAPAHGLFLDRVAYPEALYVH